jgi:predicted ester cyclase
MMFITSRPHYISAPSGDAGDRSRDQNTMSSPSRENAALVRRFLTDVLVGGDTDAVPGFLASSASDHQLVFESARRRDTVTGLGWQALASADVDLHIEDVVASDERVAVRGRVTGTHQESLMDLAPTGRSFEIACAWFFRIENNRIAEIWSLPDGLGLVKQLDAVPEEFPAGSLPDSTQQR